MTMAVLEQSQELLLGFPCGWSDYLGNLWLFFQAPAVVGSGGNGVHKGRHHHEQPLNSLCNANPKTALSLTWNQLFLKYVANPWQPVMMNRFSVCLLFGQDAHIW